MALCDRDSAAALLRELSGNFVRFNSDKSEANKATITVELHDDTAVVGEEQFIVQTVITEYPGIIGETVQQKIIIPHLNREIRIPEGLDAVIEECKRANSGIVRQEDVARFIPWIHTFASGYGPGLRTSGTAKYTEYFAPDALYPIFNYSTSLQDPETAWRRLVDAARRAPAHATNDEAEHAASATDKKISQLIHGILGLEQNDAVSLENNGIFVRSGIDSKQLIDLDAKGDGHKSLTKVILDILVWYLLFDNYDQDRQGEQRVWKPLNLVEADGSVSVPDMAGIVIIDEIEQHLHPTLQRRIIRSLSDKFPNVQFVISTHSPLCLAGTADVDEQKSQGYRVFSVYKDSAHCAIEMKQKPVGLRADQVLVDYFEMPTTITMGLQVRVERLRELFAKETLSETEAAELKELDRSLRVDAPLLAESEDDRRRELKRDKATAELRALLVQQGILNDDPT
jgi:hypothetical protein